jgi:hypothetical protein
MWYFILEVQYFSFTGNIYVVHIFYTTHFPPISKSEILIPLVFSGGPMGYVGHKVPVYIFSVNIYLLVIVFSISLV